MIKIKLIAICLLLALPALGISADTSRFQLDNDVEVDSIVIKFKEGTDITVEGGVLKTKGNTAPPPGIQIADITSGLTSIETMLKSRRLTINKTFSSFSNERLAELRHQAQAKLASAPSPSSANTKLANLADYHSIKLPAGTTFGKVKFHIERLNQLDIVEFAYASAPAPLVHNGPTGNYESYQGYLDAAPNGLEVRYAWNQPGGNGQGVRVIDIEWNVNRNHEDMPNFFFYQDPNHVASSADHGTASLGIVGALDNGIGITGIAHGAQIGFVSRDMGVSDAILRAGEELRAGDVLLLELQSYGPPIGAEEEIDACFSNCVGCVPIEWEPAVFETVQNLTARGIVVVAAAGNGGRNLDSPALQGRFDRDQQDSNAIIVGARHSDANTPRCTSTHGERVDVSAWGHNVATLGYGGATGIYEEGTDNRDYTATFSGTSSASALITGVAASLQGVVKARGFSPLTSRQMRDVLVSTGASQTADQDRPIGRYPNLRTAIDSLPNNNNCSLPAAPKNIRLTDQGSSWFTIAWNSSSGADRYIALIDSNGDKQMEPQPATTKTWFPFKRLQPGKSYFAQVVAENACGRSDPLNFVFVTL